MEYHKNLGLKQRVNIFFKKLEFFLPPLKADLLIIDDYLPNILSAFRAFEFEFLLKKVSKSLLLSFVSSNSFIKNKYQYDKFKNEFVDKFSLAANQLKIFNNYRRARIKLAYIVFLNNAYLSIDYLESNNIDFILELYPGGGLEINEEVSTKKLTRVLGSKNLKQVLVTQKITNEYLIEKCFCSIHKISFLYGGILPKTLYNLPPKTIKYPTLKSTIDICFTASKYMPMGKDKGYDLFIDAAHFILEKYKHVYFHIVGGFNEKDMEIKEEFTDNFKFYGYLKTYEFKDYYLDKDIFVSPSRPFYLGKGAFDGFPTGSCVEASLNGLCIVISDPLNQNCILTNNKDAVFIENEVTDIVTKLNNLIESPEKVYSIGFQGQKIFNKNLSVEEQLDFRLDLIKKNIK